MKRVLILLMMVLLVGCAGKKKPPSIEAMAGSFIPGYVFSIDASYDKRLDKMVPRYQLLTIAIRNTSLNLIRMDSQKDQWLLIDEEGKKWHAINSLRLKDRQLWKGLAPRVQELVEYPKSVPISYTVTFNLFFPKKVPLADFREIRYRNAISGQEFRIVKE